MHQRIWWMHTLLAFVFIAYMAYSKLLHMITGPVKDLLPRPGPCFLQ